MGKLKEFKPVGTLLIAVAILIAISSLLVSQSLVKDLSREERNKMELFAEAFRTFNNADENTDLNLVLTIITGNKTIPVIITDDSDQIRSYLNIDVRGADTLSYLADCVERMRLQGHSIRIYHDGGDSGPFTEVCYDESLLLNRLTIYPYIQLSVVVLFVVIAVFALLNYKKSEQNRVWVGLSKETAHQLGTPISSLMAWTELLKDKYDDDMIPEMEKDVNRLQMVADRFSKVGSMPAPVPEDMENVLAGVLDYMERRSPAGVTFVRDFPQHGVKGLVNASLFGWVAENLCKNAVDAMEGNGTLTVRLRDEKNCVAVEFQDTGKGIAKNAWKSVFNPGYTTKKRGWGLGLSLAHRIICDYHHGRIFVSSSEIDKGTVFRIELPKRS